MTKFTHLKITNCHRKIELDIDAFSILHKRSYEMGFAKFSTDTQATPTAQALLIPAVLVRASLKKNDGPDSQPLTYIYD